MSLRPGEVYWASFPEGLNHPVIIVSREEFNRGQYAVAVPVTSQRVEERRRLPSCVFFPTGHAGFDRDCVSQAEAISFIETHLIDLDTGPIGRLDDDDMRDLVRSIGHVMGAECEPES